MHNTKKTLRAAMAITVCAAFAQSCAIRAKQPLLDAREQLPKPVSVGVESTLVRTVEAKHTVSPKQKMRDLFRTLRHGSNEEQVSAMKELEKNANKSTIPLLLRELDDPDTSAHHVAIFLLGNLKAKSAVPELLKLVDDPILGHESIQALEKIGDKRAISALSKRTKDQDPYVRAISIRALGTLEAHESAPLILDALKSRDEPVLLSAIQAIGKLGDARAISDLINALSHRKPSIASAAADSLGAIGTPSLLPLIGTLQNASIGNRVNLIEAIVAVGHVGIPILDQAMYSASPTAAYGIVAALGLIRHKSALPILVQALEHPEANVRGTAANSLRIIGDKTAIPVLEKVVANDSSPFTVAAAQAAISSLQ